MNKHRDCKRQFRQLSECWYADANIYGTSLVDQVNVGFYHPDGGTTGEFQITWEVLAGKLVPHLKAFDDAWDALIHFDDVLKSMADFDDKNISPKDFCALLSALGIENATPKKEE